MSGSRALAPVLTPESNLSRYLHDIRQFPMLEAHEAYVLAQSWKEHGEQEAADQHVNSHLRLV
ncbi:MAG: RNA polymerase factor sigma-32, partial [Alphaproteobacteria bacterium]